MDGEYLKNVYINSINKNIILEDLYKNLDISLLSDIKNNIREILITLYPIPNTCPNTMNWIKCEGLCFSTLSSLIDIEIHSTAYMLRVLFNSLIPLNYSDFELEINEELSGKWADDYRKIKILRFGSQYTHRLILGLGPSACGKTYWARSLIEIFSKSSTTFPNLFLSIDGGLHRELSVVYQSIIELTKEFCILGFDNLVSTSFTNRSIFDSNIVKDNIVHFLENQNKSVSLYVPETLSGCGTLRYESCYNKFKKYIDITGDNNWINILIYQHKEASDCNYPYGYKCVGCSESGKEREIKEGKKYSSSMYSHSLDEAIKLLRESNGQKIIIHNSGSRTDKSTIDDYTDYTKYDLSTANIYKALLNNSEKYNYLLFFHGLTENININRVNYKNINRVNYKNKNSVLINRVQSWRGGKTKRLKKK